MINEIRYCFAHRDLHQLRKLIRGILPQRMMNDLGFYKRYHRFIDRKNPRIADEKLLMLREKEYRNNARVAQCADKYAVREYVENKGLGEILVPLLGVYEDAGEMDWDRLPDRFAMKCNHGCGMNIIVPDRKELDIEEAEAKLNEWMHIDYGRLSGELNYLHIKPRIIVEEFIETKFGILPVDYKFHCSWGRVFCAQVIAGRGIKTEHLFVDQNFEDLHLAADHDRYTGENPQALRPDSFEKMWEIAGKLSGEFPYVRVDLYDLDGRPLFGELTFMPNGGYLDRCNPKGEEWIGGQIRLEKEAG